MKCEMCKKEITSKSDLYAGPWNPTKSIYLGALSGKNIKTFHKSCYKKLPALKKMHDQKILPMNGWYGNAIMITPIILFFLVFVIFLLIGINQYAPLGVIAIFLVILLIVFEIPFYKLRSKVKREYEDKLK